MNKWDEYFLSVCNTVASNSKCLSRQVGAIIVSDKSIISTGYNGPPRGVQSCKYRFGVDDPAFFESENRGVDLNQWTSETVTCPRRMLGFKSGEGLEFCVAGHGERNAIVNAAREGIRVKGTIMYMNCSIPCSPCLVEIINAGISEIVVIGLDSYDIMAEYLIKRSGLKVRVFEQKN